MKTLRCAAAVLLSLSTGLVLATAAPAPATASDDGWDNVVAQLKCIKACLTLPTLREQLLCTKHCLESPPTPVPSPTKTPVVKTSTPTRTATSGPSATDTFTPIPSATSVFTATDTPVFTATDTPPADTATPLPSDTPTAVDTDTPTPLDTATPVDTPTPLDTATATETETSVPTPTQTPEPTATHTETFVPTDTPTASPTPSFTTTATPTPHLCVPYATLVLSHAPSLYYRLGEAGGSVATDSSLSAKNGSYQDTALLSFGEVGAIAGDSDTAVRSIGGHMSIPADPALDVGFDSGGSVMTWEGWYRTLPGVTGVYPLLNRWASGGHQMITYLSLGAEGRAWCFVEVGGIVFVAQSTSTGLGDGTWHHVVCRYDGRGVTDQIGIFVDGVGEATTPTVDEVMGGIRGNGQLWGMSDGNPSTLPTAAAPFWADEVAYYRSALTDEQIADHYAAGAFGCP